MRIPAWACHDMRGTCGGLRPEAQPNSAKRNSWLCVAPFSLASAYAALFCCAVAVVWCAAVGIGLLLAFTGLSNMGVIVFNRSTLVTLGGCNAVTERTYIYEFDQLLTAELLSNLTSQLSSNGNSTYISELATVYGCKGGGGWAALGPCRWGPPAFGPLPPPVAWLLSLLLLLLLPRPLLLLLGGLAGWLVQNNDACQSSARASWPC